MKIAEFLNLFTIFAIFRTTESGNVIGKLACCVSEPDVVEDSHHHGQHHNVEGQQIGGENVHEHHQQAEPHSHSGHQSNIPTNEAHHQRHDAEAQQIALENLHEHLEHAEPHSQSGHRQLDNTENAGPSTSSALTNENVGENGKFLISPGDAERFAVLVVECIQAWVAERHYFHRVSLQNINAEFELPVEMLGRELLAHKMALFNNLAFTLAEADFPQGMRTFVKSTTKEYCRIDSGGRTELGREQLSEQDHFSMDFICKSSVLLGFAKFFLHEIRANQHLLVALVPKEVNPLLLEVKEKIIEDRIANKRIRLNQIYKILDGEILGIWATAKVELLEENHPELFKVLDQSKIATFIESKCVCDWVKFLRNL